MGRIKRLMLKVKEIRSGDQSVFIGNDSGQVLPYISWTFLKVLHSHLKLVLLLFSIPILFSNSINKCQICTCVIVKEVFIYSICLHCDICNRMNNI